MGSQRTKAELDVLLADNTIGDITPARLRDFLESCLPSRGALAFATAATAIAAASTPVKASNVTTLGYDSRFTMPANNRLRYDGAADVSAEVTAVVTVSGAADAQLVELSLAKNGVVVSGTSFQVLLGAAGEKSQVALLAHVDLSTTDYLELFVANETSDEDVTIHQGSLRAAAFLT